MPGWLGASLQNNVAMLERFIDGFVDGQPGKLTCHVLWSLGRRDYWLKYVGRRVHAMFNVFGKAESHVCLWVDPLTGARMKVVWNTNMLSFTARETCDCI